MHRHELTPAEQQLLKEQVITADQPGPVLHDFGVLLDFLAAEGVEAAGKYNVLPMRIIGELDGRLGRPLRLELKMKRPQIRSHPYLQALNLLLRATGLSRVEGAGAKARLVLDPAMTVQWDRLNPTERYFNLLEAGFLWGRPEMVGDRPSAFNRMLMDCLRVWQDIPAGGRKFDLSRPDDVYIYGIGRDFYKLALMDLFGLVSVEHPSRPVAPWAPAGMKRLPFGDAVLTLLLDWTFPEPAADEDEEEPDESSFGVWQPLFRPYFPEWQRNLEFPELEPREGTFVFRVSLGKSIWRRIAMPADKTLDDLVRWILRSLKFDSDHLYEFTYRDSTGAQASAGHPAMDEGPWADEIAIGELPLEPGQSMQLLYDFGDNWRFDVKLERIEPPDAPIKAPSILERHGESPEQYGDW